MRSLVSTKEAHRPAYRPSIIRNTISESVSEDCNWAT